MVKYTQTIRRQKLKGLNNLLFLNKHHYFYINTNYKTQLFTVVIDGVYSLDSSKFFWKFSFFYFKVLPKLCKLFGIRDLVMTYLGSFLIREKKNCSHFQVTAVWD